MKQKDCRKVDWNSLFSTISQASASMIGVILAFLVARIISESSDYDRLEYDSQALVDESIDLKARILSMNFEWHDARIFEDYDFREAQADQAELHSASNEEKTSYIKKILPRLYYPEKFIAKLDAEITAARMPTRRPSDQPLGIEGYMAMSNPPRLTNPRLWELLNSFEDDFENISFRVQSVIRRHKSLERAFHRNISDMNSLSRSLLLLAPAILLTVIYPLHFLPVPDGTMPSLTFSLSVVTELIFSIKGFFLVLLTCLSLGLLVFLSIFCRRHVAAYRGKIRAINEYYIDKGWYSDRIKEFNPLLLSGVDPLGDGSVPKSV